MSTLRVSNIEAKADSSSPTIDEKVKITNSTGDVMLHLDGSTSGITTVGINTTGNAFTVDAGQNINFTGVVTATSLSGNLTGNVNAGVVTATSSIVVGNSFVKATSIGIGTTTTSGRNAGVGTAIGTLVYNTTTKGIEVYDGTGWITGLQSFFATGGTLDTSSRAGYSVHTFTTPDSFVIGGTSPKTVEVLVVAGGGGGPKGTGTGGSGAGGLLYSNSVPFAPGTYTIQVGGGGAGAVANNSLGTVGTPSFITNPGISSITAIGGGTGSRNGETGSPGGSGGGAGGASINGSNRPQTTGDQGPSGGLTGYGNPGGTTTGGGEYAGSGGGGAAAAGGPGGNPGGGSGGNGLSYSINGSNTTYAGGGGGGHESDSTNVPAASGLGGTGGGGNGGILLGSNPRLPTSGSANRGGGAGGNGGNQTAGSGGSGIVIIAYPTA